ncbi:MAG: peptidase S41 [Pseudoalteromonas spongiae]
MRAQLILAMLVVASFNLNAANLTTKQQKLWLEDIDFYQNEVKTKHINPFHTLSETEFNKRLRDLKNDLANLSEVEVEARLMAITGALGDGHSNYFMMSGPHQHFPFRYKFFEGTLRVVDTTNAYRSLRGTELKTINDKSVSELFKIVSPLLPGVDNQFSAKTSFEYYLTLHKLLLGLNIVKEGQPTKFEFWHDGQVIEKAILPVSMGEFGQLSSAFSQTLPKLQNTDIAMPGIRLSYFNKKNIAYFAFKSYPKFEQVVDNCTALQTELKSAQSRYLVIDFRGNGGGNFYTGLAFSSCLLPLDQFDWQHGVYILTDGQTFSAAMSNTVQYQQILNAKIVGTPTGGDPNHYAESYRFTLPNSKRKLSLSKRYYAFAKEPTDAIYPDIQITPTWQDYQNGKDTVLLEVLKLINQHKGQ